MKNNWFEVNAYCEKENECGKYSDYGIIVKEGHTIFLCSYHAKLVNIPPKTAEDVQRENEYREWEEKQNKEERIIAEDVALFRSRLKDGKYIHPKPE